MELDVLLGTVDEAVRPEDRVLELGCGSGRWTGVLASRARMTVAFDPSPAGVERTMDRHMGMPGLTFVHGDVGSLDELEDADTDLVVVHGLFRRLSSAKAVLGYVEQLGRVLAPGGRAVLAMSTDPTAGEQRASRRDLLRGLTSRRAEAPAGAFVPLDALGAVAVQAGLTLDRIEGSGTRDTVALVRKPASTDESGAGEASASA
jgi:SAM-dependent methyltransferase